MSLSGFRAAGWSLLMGLASVPAAQAAGTDFYTVTPCRLVDTRGVAGPSGGPNLSPKESRGFGAAGQCGVSTAAEAVAVNVTVVPSGTGHLSFARGRWITDCGHPPFPSELHPMGVMALMRTQPSPYLGSASPKTTYALITANGFFKMLRKAGESIGMADVHPHLLRHACGFKLVNQGVDTRTLAAYLGHRQMANTARYTKMDANRFDGFWQD